MFSPLGPGPVEPAEVSLTVFGVMNSLQYLPAISMTHTSVEVGVAGDVIRINVHSAVLDLLEIRHSKRLVSCTSPSPYQQLTTTPTLHAQ